MWKTDLLTDKSDILAYLETDRLYAGYAIGDLEPGLFESCTWVRARRNQAWALALCFRGLNPPVAFFMGDEDGFSTILASTTLPSPVYLTCRPDHLPAIDRLYGWEKMSPMWRMVLRPGRFHPATGSCLRLRQEHAGQLAALLAMGDAVAFDPAQLSRGVFYGIFTGQRLVAVAGTHLVSPTYAIAAVGNVFTHPDFRGRGYATTTTTAVVAELLRRSIDDVILNVGQDNPGARHVYEQLGFDVYCPFIEGPATARGAARRPDPD